MSNAHDRTCPDNYERCLIKPMTDKDGQPLIEPVHLVDAAIVAAIVFFSLLLGDAVPAILTGRGAYVTLADIYRRLPTAAIAFGLVLFSQWARYRGIQLREALPGSEGNRNE